MKMATIKPFMGIRPRVGLESKIAALPYDVYNRAEACEVVKANPDSFLAIDRAETQFDASVDTYDERVYAKAHDMLWDRIEKGDFIQDVKEVYYIYELIMDGRSQTGIVACSSIDDYINNVIKKHENTRADKEVDRIKHVSTCEAQTGPIFLAYRSNSDINNVIAKVKNACPPVYDFTADDSITHKVWVIENDSDIKIIRESFEAMDAIYIADGHHRCASAAKVGIQRREANPGYKGTEEFNFFLSVLFPDDQLMIMDYNRVVRDLNGLTKDEFMGKIAEVFECAELPAQAKPNKKGDVSMYIDGKWYGLSVRKEYTSADPIEGLDVSILQNNILKPVLGIDDPKTDKRIDFVGGIRGLNELERRVSEDSVVAFAMYPTSIGELFDVADAKLLMPPKSTWFEPKLRSGLFIHSIK